MRRRSSRLVESHPSLLENVRPGDHCKQRGHQTGQARLPDVQREEAGGDPLLDAVGTGQQLADRTTQTGSAPRVLGDLGGSAILFVLR